MHSVVLLSLFVAAALGCSPPPQPRSSASTGGSAAPSTPTQHEATAGQRLDKAVADVKTTADDAALTAKVKTALANDVGLKTLKIDVDANGGVVVLKGQVDTDDMKNRAQEAAQSVKGVTWVQNQLSVAPKAG
jgi:hyperosmotically inducible protein